MFKLSQIRKLKNNSDYDYELQARIVYEQLNKKIVTPP